MSDGTTERSSAPRAASTEQQPEPPHILPSPHKSAQPPPSLSLSRLRSSCLPQRLPPRCRLSAAAAAHPRPSAILATLIGLPKPAGYAGPRCLQLASACCHSSFQRICSRVGYLLLQGAQPGTRMLNIGPGARPAHLLPQPLFSRHVGSSLLPAPLGVPSCTRSNKRVGWEPVMGSAAAEDQ